MIQNIGVAPSLVLLQVRNTAPFLFENGSGIIEPTYVYNLKSLADKSDLSHADYFKLCVSAHWATVATFVPTDLDIHIRYKLWNTVEALDEMTHLVKESKFWDYRPVSVRWVEAQSGQRLSGHDGEWFSIAVAAYSAAKKAGRPEQAVQILGWIGLELERQDQIFKELLDSENGVEVLKAAYVIAHNLGDLKRVMEHWALDQGDSLFDLVLDFLPRFDIAAELNRTVMAAENHRHLFLRKPRGLRKSLDFLLPFSPFLDDWGSRIARHPALTDKDRGEIIEALVEGQEKLANFTGYSRALLGIEEAIEGGRKRMSSLVPARVGRLLQNGEIRKLMSIPKARFMEQWAAKAWAFESFRSN